MERGTYASEVAATVCPIPQTILSQHSAIILIPESKKATLLGVHGVPVAQQTRDHLDSIWVCRQRP